MELVADQETKEPLAPYGGTSAAMNAVVGRASREACSRLSNFNRIHIVPPCNVSDQEVRDGLAILDTALDVAAQASSAPPPPL